MQANNVLCRTITPETAETCHIICKPMQQYGPLLTSSPGKKLNNEVKRYSPTSSPNSSFRCLPPFTLQADVQHQCAVAFKGAANKKHFTSYVTYAQSILTFKRSSHNKVHLSNIFGKKIRTNEHHARQHQHPDKFGGQP